jgi:hypothetical protein
MGGDYGGIGAVFETSICCPALFDDLECVNQGLGKSLLIIRLQQIVNSVDFECTEGVLAQASLWICG